MNFTDSFQRILSKKHRVMDAARKFVRDLKSGNASIRLSET